MTSPATSSRRLVLMRIGAIARRHFLAMLRSPHRLFDVAVWPVVDALLFGAIGAFVATEGTGGARAFGYLLGGIVLWHVVYQAQISVSTGFLEETWSRNLLNLMVTPLKEWEYVAGVAAFGLVKLVLGVGVTALITFVAFSFDITELGVQILPIAALLLAVGWVIALFVIGCILRYGSGAEALAWGILFAVMPLSGVFYPVEALPGALQPVARILPTTHAFEALRGLIDRYPLDWGLMADAAAGTLALTVGALLFLTRMLRLFRMRGYISRYS